MSVVIRTQLKGIFQNGNPFEKSVITKIYPAVSDKFVTLVRTRDLFCNEAHAYENILPAIGAKSLAPEYFFANSEKIIMEDLTRVNFFTCDRQHLLNYNHCRHVLQALAHIHAGSLKLKLNNPEYFRNLIKPITEVTFADKSNGQMKNSLEKSLNHAIQSLESIQPPTANSEKCLKFLKKYPNKVYEIVKASTTNRSIYDVIIHGDVWKNNIFFSKNIVHDELKVKFVDYQAVRHASLALDIHYFLYSSADLNVFDNHYRDMMQIYHTEFLNQLKSTITMEHYDALNYNWFSREIEKHAVYGLFFALSLVHVIMADDGSIKLSVSENGQELNTKVPFSMQKTKRIESIVTHFINTFGDID
ncbi:uncharacterized protein LOC127282154 isoform X2 [Leptopilina boulardi]|nr:uncharacterized protein LOC127282154 isoform X2 [Leptopilina boulardi]